jgi:hypothetical protein
MKTVSIYVVVAHNKPVIKPISAVINLSDSTIETKRGKGSSPRTEPFIT